MSRCLRSGTTHRAWKSCFASYRNCKSCEVYFNTARSAAPPHSTGLRGVRQPPRPSEVNCVSLKQTQRNLYLGQLKPPRHEVTPQAVPAAEGAPTCPEPFQTSSSRLGPHTLPSAGQTYRHSRQVTRCQRSPAPPKAAV